jgi:hypothetical protein
MEAGGSKTRPICHLDVHHYKAYDEERSQPSSQEVFDSLLQESDKLAVVVSAHKDRGLTYWRSFSDAPPALAVAVVCDAAGLMAKGTKVICCSLGERSVKGQTSCEQRWDETCLLGHTAHKARAVAEATIAAGARLISAPTGWGESLVQLDAWLMQRADSVARYASGRHGEISLAEIPVLLEPTEEVLKIARLQENDALLSQRKLAVTKLRKTFRSFDAPMQKLVKALSFDLIEPDDEKNKPYKIPAWKKRLLEPSIPSEVRYRVDGTGDKQTVSITACATLWQAVFDKYLIAPVPEIKRNKHLNNEEYDVALEGWRQVGTALGVEDALRAVIEDGVAIEDVLSLM